MPCISIIPLADSINVIQDPSNPKTAYYQYSCCEWESPPGQLPCYGPYEKYRYFVQNGQEAAGFAFRVAVTGECCLAICINGVANCGGQNAWLPSYTINITRIRNGETTVMPTQDCKSTYCSFYENSAECNDPATNKTDYCKLRGTENGDIYDIYYNVGALPDGTIAFYPAGQLSLDIYTTCYMGGELPNPTPGSTGAPASTPEPTSSLPTPTPLPTASNTGQNLWVWGDNSTGQLGNGNKESTSSLVQTLVTGKYWRQVSVGYAHMAGIQTNNSLWLWGDNSYLQLSGLISAGTNRSSPVQLDQNMWQSVSCGYYNTAAIRKDGSLWIWGTPKFGMYGNNSEFTQIFPVQTLPGGNNWAQVSVGNYHIGAIKKDGSLWMWGNNYAHQLGNPTASLAVSSPIQTFYATNDWEKVECGYNYTLAIKTDGTAWAWGLNYGNLGLGTDQKVVSVPMAISSVQGEWLKIAAAYDCAGGINKSDVFLTPTATPSSTEPTPTPTPSSTP